MKYKQKILIGKNKKKEKIYYVIKDFDSDSEDRWCLVGTKEDLANAITSKFECSRNVREIKTIPPGRRLFWVEFSRENWAGSGGGSSDLCTNLKQAEEWIIKHIKEWRIDIGVVRFCIYPVYKVGKTEEK